MKTFAVFIFALLLAPGARAQQQTFVVNADASQVKITLNTTHEVVHGSFHIQAGAIEFDRSAPGMSGSVTVVAGSGQTGSSSRDKRMNKEILEVQQYATVSFAPKTYAGAITPSGDSTVQVTGIFTLLGKPHEINIPMLIHIDGTTAVAKAHFVIPYIQWGLRDPSFLFWKADKDVAVDLLLTGALSR